MTFSKIMPDGTVITESASNEGHEHILLREGFTEVKPAKKAPKPAPPTSED